MQQPARADAAPGPQQGVSARRWLDSGRGRQAPLCETGSVALGGRCFPFSSAIATVVVPLLVAAAAAFFGLYWLLQRHKDGLNYIKVFPRCARWGPCGCRWGSAVLRPDGPGKAVTAGGACGGCCG